MSFRTYAVTCIALATVTVAGALLSPVSAAPPQRAASTCPPRAFELAAETMVAAKTHQVWIEYLDAGGTVDKESRQFHVFWERSHRETAGALLQATVGCP